MAKVTAPLFSFGASGKLADALVYFPWKGIHAVRSFVIPSNPNTAAQQAQRSNLDTAVGEWHTVGLDADDITAWNRYAATRVRPQSGFNAFVGNNIDIQVAGRVPLMPFNGSIVDDGDDTFSGVVSTPGAANRVEMRYGPSPTSMFNSLFDLTGPTPWTFAPVTLHGGQRVYAQFIAYNITPLELGRSGIYAVNVA